MSIYDPFDAELAVIGAAFLDPSAVEASGCEVEHFAHRNHRIMWRALQAVRSKGRPVDTVTVTTELEATRQLAALRREDGQDPADLVADYAEASATALNVAHHGQIVRRAHRARALRALLQSQPAAALKVMLDGDGTDEAIDEAAEVMVGALMQFAQGGPRKARHTLTQASRAAIAHVQRVYEAFHGGKQVEGVIPWGIEAIDAQIPMMEAGELYGLCARSGEGKTMVGWQMARGTAALTGRVTDYFTSEVDARGIAMRHLSGAARVDGRQLQSGALADGDIHRLMQAVTLTSAGIGELVEIHDAAPTTLEGITSTLRLIDATRPDERKGGLVVVDYWQRITTSAATRGASREQVLNGIARDLKTLAQIIRRPVLLLAQFNRETIRRAGGRGMAVDVRESSGLEHECTTLLGLNLPGKIGLEAPPDYCEVYAMKGRTGAQGIIPLRHVGKWQRVEAWTGDPWSPSRQGGARP